MGRVARDWPGSRRWASCDNGAELCDKSGRAPVSLIRGGVKSLPTG